MQRKICDTSKFAVDLRKHTATKCQAAWSPGPKKILHCGWVGRIRSRCCCQHQRHHTSSRVYLFILPRKVAFCIKPVAIFRMLSYPHLVGASAAIERKFCSLLRLRAKSLERGR
jgi:hypothetical protein